MMKRNMFSTGRNVRALASWFLLAACCAANVWGRDAFVMLSGGDSPMDNNYSQYLQAKAITAYFLTNYPNDSVWVFFGAGNVEGQKPAMGDVLREVKRDGVLVDSWVAGSLPHNRPATREVFLRALREEILPAVADGGTLYLFVGDHGSRSEGKEDESIISMWGMYRDESSDHGWNYHEGKSLGVTELRNMLARGMGKGRLVFCMTQCHAGGFHYLAIPHEMTPNPKWFTTAPEWAQSAQQTVFPRAAGFTATDEYSLASGCDPAPDPADWAGYERYLPESLLGINLFTQERTHAAMKSFAEAHQAATLKDGTIDKPYSTSDQYLERWADLIETRLAKEPNLTAKVKKSVEAYQRAVNGTAARVSDRAFQERQALFGSFIARLCEQNRGAGNLLRAGTQAELEETINPPRTQARTQARNQRPGTRQGRRNARGGGQTRRLWTETIRPAWKDALEANQAADVPVEAREFEKHLLSVEEEEGRNFFTGNGGRFLDDEIYWESGYSDPQTLNTAKAEAIALWAVERRNKILEWAKKSDNEEVRTAAEQLSRNGTQRRGAAQDTGAASVPLIDKKTAAERTLFYRRALAAWEFLIAVNEKPALTRLRELTELERTPLPPAKR